MFHMLSCFNLAEGSSLEQYEGYVARFTAELKASGLVHSIGPIGRRQRHPVMDTDDERDHEFFFIISFEDREQCDRAVAEVFRHEGSLDDAHASILGPVADPVFICWEDI